MDKTQKEEFFKRRKAFAKQLASNSVAIICSASMKQRSHDTFYPYRQNSNLYYLCGITQEETTLVIVKKKKKFRTIVFIAKKDPIKEIWEGKKLSKKEIRKTFGIQRVFTQDKLEKKLQLYLQKAQRVYYSFSSLPKKKELFQKISTHKDVDKILFKMRLIKSTSEIATIKQAIAITTKAHIEAMRVKKIKKYEYQLQALFEYIFKKNGAYSDAYTTIVAGGNNANILHYIQNNALLQENELVLIDAGCEYNYYASDVTRTIPISGVFSQPQKAIYSLVLDVQKKIIAMIKPGVLRSDLQKKAQKLLTKGLIELGILEGDLEELVTINSIGKYYPHGIGHYMGLDVHDPSAYKDKKQKEIPLMAGMIITIEPGLYLPKEDTTIPKKYRGIGVRIEDDILVTEDGYENLTKAIPKEIAQIEALYEAREF